MGIMLKLAIEIKTSDQPSQSVIANKDFTKDDGLLSRRITTKLSGAL